MNKIYNWLFGSFFRTLGRILVYIFFGVLISMLLSSSDIKLPNVFGMLDVHADVPFDVHIGYDSAKQTWFQGARNITTGIYDSTCDECTPPGLDKVGTYGYIKICTNAVIPSYYSNNEPNINNLEYYNTNVPCNFGTMRGTIRYFTFGTEWSCSVTGSSCTFGYSITWYQNDSADYYVIDANSMNEPIQIDMASGIIINNQSSNTSDIINNNNNNTNNIINNQTQNKNEIINNNNNNTNNIINNQNQNTDKEIESQQVCKEYDKNSIVTSGGLNQNGSILTDNNFGITDYININKATITLNNSYSSSTYSYCFYNVNKNLISCSLINSNNTITIPDNAYYFRGTIRLYDNKPTYKICKNGNQAIGDSINDLNNDINNSDSSGATNNATDFFNNFTTNTHGLTGIITAPLSAIQSLSGATCTPLELPLPFVNKTLPLPCMRVIYDEFFGDFMSIYDVVTLGIVSYWVLVRIFSLVKDFKNPEHDELEVLDL